MTLYEYKDKLIRDNKGKEEILLIKEVIVVEGKDDIAAVKKAVNAEMIATGGFGINAKDFAGEKIRKIIAKRVPGIKHAYIAQEDGIKDDDIGVENASPEVIIEALNRAKVTLEEKVETFDAQDMFYFRLNGDPNAKARRIKLGNKLGIGYGNANQMLSRLNNYGITKEEFIEAIKYVDAELEKEK